MSKKITILKEIEITVFMHWYIFDNMISMAYILNNCIKYYTYQKEKEINK